MNILLHKLEAWKDFIKWSCESVLSAGVLKLPHVEPLIKFLFTELQKTGKQATLRDRVN